jgi:hypothetical protein
VIALEINRRKIFLNGFIKLGMPSSVQEINEKIERGDALVSPPGRSDLPLLNGVV